MEIHRGDIVYIEKRNDTIGHEQYSGRPAVVVSNDKGNMSSGTVEVVYLTTQPKHDIPTHVQIRSIGRLSTALCEQIWTISTERIGNLIGSVTEEEMAALEEAILISLGITQNGGVISGNAQETLTDALEAEIWRAKFEMIQEMYEKLLERVT